MKVANASKRRNERYDGWYEILIKEMALVCPPSSKFNLSFMYKTKFDEIHSRFGEKGLSRFTPLAY